MTASDDSALASLVGKKWLGLEFNSEMIESDETVVNKLRLNEPASVKPQ